MNPTSNLASDSDSFEAFLPREPHGVAMGIAALMAAATPTPVPPAAGPGCHRWRYALRWEQPSRLALLKNVLGNSVTTYTDFNAPGSGNQNDWPDPIDRSEIAGAWKYTAPTNPNGSFTRPYNHDCGVGLPACLPATPTDLEGEQPGIYYSKGTWDWPKPGPLKVAYDPNYPPLYHPGSDTTGSRFYTDKYKDPPISSPVPTAYVAAPYGTAGNYDGWAWTLNYGYAAPPTNDIIYGPDPGPPFGFDSVLGTPALMDETTDGSLPGPCGGPSTCGNSIPGTTGTPLSFPTAWSTVARPIGVQTQTILERDSDKNAVVIQFGGVGQPSWTMNIHRDVVGFTKDFVNWGLMTFADPSPFSGAAACIPTNYDLKVKVDCPADPGPCALDTGDVTKIESYMRLRSAIPAGAYPGLGVDGGTPTAGAIDKADSALTATWGVDPKKACNRAYGVILCTDGESNTCNTGSSGDGNTWGQDPCPTCLNPGDTPCTVDTAGSAFANFPPGAAEATYLDAHQVPGGAIIRARTFAIGISPDISRCELNRTAYRGRTDANAAKKDAGFVLWDSDPTLVPLGGGGDARLPHVDSPQTASTAIGTDESGAGSPPAPNRFGPDQTPPDKADYAFFANDARALYDAFLAIVRGSASGDYTTSAPVSGAAVSVGSTVILTSATYPLWHGHIKALDTTNAFATPPTPITEIWDAGQVLTTPNAAKPWQPTPATRQLYTWDPLTGALIEIVAANAGAIGGLCGAPCASPTAPPMSSLIDFIRGIDTRDFILGSGNVKIANPNKGLPRPWLLGPSINVTPAIVGPAQPYFQAGNVVNHKPFEGLYANRRSLAWLGADDGFLHAFDFGDKLNPGDGAEVLGLMPPNLIATQIDLYNTFQDLDPQVQTDTGENAGFLFDEHTWGVASSLRFADVWFGASTAVCPSGCYKTVGFLTEGAGGDLVAAIDITHPYGGPLGPLSRPGVPADNKYGLFPGANAGKPVDVLWTKNSTDYSGLFGTWSVPAVANDTFTTSKMTFGAGINPTSLYNAVPAKSADVFVVDPTTGALLSTTAVAPLASPSPLVGHQTFTDSIFFQTTDGGFQNDNLANLSLQADENGRVNALFGNWSSPTSSVLINLNDVVGGPQPLHYSPAANGIGTLGFQVYALASGSFYETSPAVSGWNVNRIAPKPPAGSGFPDDFPVFVPTLFVAANPNKITDAAFPTTTLNSLPFVISKTIAGIPLQLTDPTYSDGSVNPLHTSLGIHTQVTASPLLVGNSTSTTQRVFFTVFDPDYGCNGYSYVVGVQFAVGELDSLNNLKPPSFVPNAAGCESTIPQSCGTTVYAAGAGAASGFVVTDKGAFVGQSGVGKNEATLVQVPIPQPQIAGETKFRPVWWKEQR